MIDQDVQETGPSLRGRVEALLSGLGHGGSFGPCPYTTAWLARLRGPDGTALFPRARRWLVRRQWPDGSWGGEIELPHDRTVCTLAAVVALTGPCPPLPRQDEAVRAGLAYLRSRSRPIARL